MKRETTAALDLWERQESAKRRSDEKEALAARLESDQKLIQDVLQYWRDHGITSTGAATLVHEAGRAAYGKALPHIAAATPADPATMAAIQGD